MLWLIESGLTASEEIIHDPLIGILHAFPRIYRPPIFFLFS